jgi:hypothetical protein
MKPGPPPTPLPLKRLRGNRESGCSAWSLALTFVRAQKPPRCRNGMLSEPIRR